MEVGWSLDKEIRFDFNAVYAMIALLLSQHRFTFRKKNSDLIGQNYSVDQKGLIPFGVLIGLPLFKVIFVIYGLKRNFLFRLPISYK